VYATVTDIESIVVATLETLPTQLAVLDSDGDIQYTNRAWERFGRENDAPGDTSMVGENYLAVCDATDDPDSTTAARGIRSVLSGERDEFAFEYPCHSPDEQRWFLMRATGFEHAGEPHALVMHLNITERKLAELSVEEQNQQLETVASILSHDLRNPLTVALGRAGMLDEAGTDHENVESLTASLERMETIIGDALMLTRGRDVEDTEPVTLRETARDAWSHVDTGDSTLDVAGNIEGAVVAADRSLLMQLLENLFRNAVEHAGETVTVTVETVGDGDGRGFAVADDGPGIPEEEREHVFDVGHTTDGGGTGMGLAIVELIAEAHGWDVTVGESGTGGARFAVTGVETIPTPDSTAESD